MKICLISNLYPPNVLGGAEVSVKKVSEELVKKGHEVIVITTPFSENDVEIINGVKIYQVKPLNLYEIYHHPNQSMLLKPLWHIIDLWNPFNEKNIRKILKSENPDIVHVHNFKGLSLSSFAPAKSLGIPLVFTAHDYSLICMRANLLNSSGEICKNPSSLCKIYNQIQKYLVKNKVDLLISPSEFVINKLKSEGLFKDVKSKKIPLGIDFKSKEKIEKDYSLINILYVGNLGEHKGVHFLLKAFKNINNRNIRLDIVGKGLYREKLELMSENDNRIKFYDFLEGEELIKMYRNANLTVVPSIWYDNSPMVIYESFSCRTPVIGSRIGGIPELIEDGFNGFLFEAGNVNELQQLLENLIDSPEILKKLEQGTYETVQKYTIDKHIKRLEKEYQKLVK